MLHADELGLRPEAVDGRGALGIRKEIRPRHRQRRLVQDGLEDRVYLPGRGVLQQGVRLVEWRTEAKPRKPRVGGRLGEGGDDAERACEEV